MCLVCCIRQSRFVCYLTLAQLNLSGFYLIFKNKTADLVSHYSFSIMSINGLICQRFVHVMQILSVSVSRVTLCLTTKGYTIIFDVSMSLCNGVN